MSHTSGRLYSYKPMSFVLTCR